MFIDAIAFSCGKKTHRGGELCPDCNILQLNFITDSLLHLHTKYCICGKLIGYIASARYLLNPQTKYL